MFELTRDFAFRAVPDVCTNRHIPGGDFCVRVTLRQHQTDCMVMPLSELNAVVCSLLDSLHMQDVCKVMDLPPLKDMLWPSLELMARWLFKRLKPELPDLWSVSVSRDDTWQERATYWQRPGRSANRCPGCDMVAPVEAPHGTQFWCMDCLPKPVKPLHKVTVKQHQCNQCGATFTGQPCPSCYSTDS